MASWKKFKLFGSKNRKENHIQNVAGTSLKAENYVQSHDAGGSGNALKDFRAPTVSPSEAGVSQRHIIANRAMSMTRNNPWLARGLKVHVANEIGNGIQPVPKTGDDDVNNELMDLWNDLNKQFDINGVQNATGIQAQAVRARKEQGECFIRIVKQRTRGKYRTPVKFKVLESALCPYEYTNFSLENGHYIRYGFEFNKSDKIVAYWMYENHPHDFLVENRLIRIPADEIIHHHVPKRAGELRPAPEMSRGIPKAYLYDKYDNAELVRKDVRAQFTGVIERDGQDVGGFKFDPLTGQEMEGTDAAEDDVPVLDLESGTFPLLEDGEKLKLFNGDNAGDGYIEFQKNQLLGISAAIDTPREFVTGDFGGINDRVARVILNQYHREIEQDQTAYTIPQVCERIWEAFVDGCVLHGLISIPEYATKRHIFLRCLHRTHQWDYIHPLQDVQAQAIAVENGFESRHGVVSKRNRDVRIVDEERLDDLKREVEILEMRLEYGLVKGAALPAEDDENDEKDDKSDDNQDNNKK